jgi:putative zinc finger/helix-turn-helix YgiT family protein
MKMRDTDEVLVNDERCPDCDGLVQTEHVLHRFTYGVGRDATDIECMLPIRACRTCGAEYVDEEGEAIRHEAVCRHLGVLTPREVQRLREQYGTQSAFAALTGIGEASLSRWETGASIQSKAYDNYLRLLQRPENIRSLVLRQNSPIRREQRSSNARFRSLQINRSHLLSQAAFVLRPAA